MNWVLTLAALALCILAAIALWARLAPTDPAHWHRPPDVRENADLTGGAKRVLEAGEETLSRLDAIILATPRTVRLAGSVEEGMITYVTRSALFGFPDYTTVRQVGGRLEIHGRLRFGQSDLGVNARRIDGWLQALRQGGG